VAYAQLLNNASVISVEDTRAGYFLNLKRWSILIRDLNPDDYLRLCGQSYQWDQGIWALPFAATRMC